MELHSFDESYLDRLKAGDAAVQRHFVAYFSELLLIKLRARFLPRDLVDDVRQETFARVLAALKRSDGIRNPERLGAFVNSICNNVLLEQYRSSARSDALEGHPEPVDKAIDLDGALVCEKDRNILRALFLEERDKDQVCRDLGVNRDYLRVLLHRAKSQFRLHYQKSQRVAVTNK